LVAAWLPYCGLWSKQSNDGTLVPPAVAGRAIVLVIAADLADCRRCGCRIAIIGTAATQVRSALQQFAFLRSHLPPCAGHLVLGDDCEPDQENADCDQAEFGNEYHRLPVGHRCTHGGEHRCELMIGQSPQGAEASRVDLKSKIQVLENCLLGAIHLGGGGKKIERYF
jgi:hypothetical protein